VAGVLPALTRFDPSEPRDSMGRWTDGGGDDGDGSGAVIDVDKVEAKTQANVAAASARAAAAGHQALPGNKGSHPDTIASRQPTAKGSQPGYGQPDLAAMQQDAKRYEHDIGLFKNADFYPNFRPTDFAGATDQAARTVVDQLKANLKFMFSFADQHSHIWYDGARALVDDRAKIFGFNDASIAGVYAALSPTKDWDQNVQLGDALMQTYKTQQDTRWTKEMDDKAKTLWSAKNQKFVDLVRGKTLGELKTATEKAVWIRTYNETHSSKDYHKVLPDGRLDGLVRTKAGAPAKVVWQSLPSITNAVKALEANGDKEKISAAMGAAHKVRSFYNNILDPHSANGDVTIDTHAVGAALLRQLSNASVPVVQNFGSSLSKEEQPPGYEAATSSTKSGLSGLYPVYAQAYREAAKELGIQPRQLQSAVWVVKRDAFGNLSDKQKDAIEAAWQDYHDRPEKTLGETQAQVAEISGLKKNARRFDGDHAKGRHRGDAGELHRAGLGPAAAAMDGRAGAGIAAGAAGLVAVREPRRRAGSQEVATANNQTLETARSSARDAARLREVDPMPISPGKEESQEKWMARCVPEMMGAHGGTKRPQDQAVAACLQMWRDAHPGGEPPNANASSNDHVERQDFADDIDTPEPDEDESHDDYIDRCVDEVMNDNDDLEEDDAENACQIAWEDYRAAHDGVRHKTNIQADEIEDLREFTLSDETLDRMGDVISSDGWQLESFLKNPIALFNHNPSAIVGTWKNLRVENKQLRGHLQLAPKGISPRIDEIRALVEAGILRAVSVGFRELESEPLKGDDGKHHFGMGYRFLKQELVETSLVSVPANANALAVAKSLKISSQTLDLVFAKHGKRDRIKQREFTGKHAKSSRNGKGDSMSSLGQRITALEAQLVETRDALEEHLTHMDDSNVSDADLQKTSDLNATIAQLEKTRTALVDSEKALGQSADNGSGGNSRALALAGNREHLNGSSSFAPRQRDAGKKELDAIGYLVRAATVAYFTKTTGRLAPDVRQKIYGDDEPTREACDLILRAPSAPAMTTVVGWAQELVHQIYTDFMQILMPDSLLPGLAARGIALSFGNAGRIIIPTRQRTPTLAGSFVGEGLAIPVRQGAFASQTLTPKKVAVISTYTREMSDHSIPAIEGLLREALQVDTAVAIDTVLIDANPATTIRPAGLLNGVSGLTPTAGGGLTALTGDLKLLTQGLVAGTYGNVRSPVWLVNPGDLIAATLTSAANTGIFPFRDEIKQGTLGGIPFIKSVTMPAHQMVLVDAADFVVVGGEAPRLEISDQATLHLEDTAPLDLVTGSPGVVASPQKSLFQTDSLAIRMVMPLNWLQRRAGTIAWMTGTTWS
jgi:HK97 family phage prohead protease/HK97 family phage major capsid protein